MLEALLLEIVFIVCAPGTDQCSVSAKQVQDCQAGMQKIMQAAERKRLDVRRVICGEVLWPLMDDWSDIDEPKEPM
ncbi:MAG: hypothetical protein AAGI11_15065 [Pseudomonadota bacterium]